MTAPAHCRVVVIGCDAALWLSANVLRSALGHAGVDVTAIELPGHLVAADVYASLPPLEALHSQLGVDEKALLRAVQGVFTLGQNFVDKKSGKAGFLHAYGAIGTVIDGQDFFAYWLKARSLGLPVGLEDFSLTAAAARQARLLIPDDETEKYGRSDYGYHLPAAAYVRSLKALAVQDGMTVHMAESVEVVRSEDGIAAVVFGGHRIEGDLFIDATGNGQLFDALGVARESWRDSFPADRLLIASAPQFASIPTYAEIRADPLGWVGLHPSRARTHVIQATARNLCSDEEARRGAMATSGLDLTDITIRTLDPGVRESAWAGNVIAIGGAAATFDPLHNVDLLGIQLGLVQLLASYPSASDLSAERAEYVRVMRSSYERLRDFQALHYRINAYGGAFWARARGGAVSSELAHRIALFRARGEIAPYEDESFAPDSWRSLLIGHDIVPDTYVPVIDRTPPEEMKAQFRHMLGFVKEQVLRQPTHDSYLQTIAPRHDHG